MRKLFRLLGVLAVLTVSTTSLARAGAIAYTFDAADLGQGIWGGGSLFGDGSAGGNLGYAFNNGQNVGSLLPTGWVKVGVDPVTGADLIVIFFKVQPTKGPPPFPSPAAFGPLPATGQPTKLFIPGADQPTIIRVTKLP
jgi:hypothetical protein